jgi:uncharacterized protein YjdB
MHTRAFALVALASAATLAACSPPTQPLNTATGLSFVADPASFFLAAGEAQTVTVSSFPIGGASGTVKWSTTDPAVVTVDSIVEVGAPATVRAVSPGSASLRAVIGSNGTQVSLNVAVRVRAGG